MDLANAQAKAKEVLEENFVLEPPVDVYSLAENYGIKIKTQEFPDDYSNVSGFINIEDSVPVMYINSDDSENRKKFTIAHELGHWILHEEAIRKDPEKAVLFRVPLGRANKDPMESEANAFAAEILVPMEFFETLAPERSNDELAEIFKVSAEVIGSGDIPLEDLS